MGGSKVPLTSCSSLKVFSSTTVTAAQTSKCTCVSPSLWWSCRWYTWSKWYLCPFWISIQALWWTHITETLWNDYRSSSLLQFEAYFRVTTNYLTRLANSWYDYMVVLNLLDWLIDRFPSEIWPVFVYFVMLQFVVFDNDQSCSHVDVSAQNLVVCVTLF